MDVYPVTLTHQGQTRTKCKARIDQGNITVWAWDPQEGQGVAVYTSVDVTRSSPRRWVTPDATITRPAGCGCGDRSPLKRWRPPRSSPA